MLLWTLLLVSVSFQSASALASGRLPFPSLDRAIISFNPRPLSRADDINHRGFHCSPARFNPRPLSRADDPDSDRTPAGDGRFNPRPLSRADDVMRSSAVPATTVSIRVRSRERTIRSRMPATVSAMRRIVSIRVRSRERTMSGRIGGTRTSSFNPRPLSRADDSGSSTCATIIAFQSASALASGRSRCIDACPPVRFNPRPLSRADDTSGVRNLRTDTFQSASALASGRCCTR